MLPTDSSNKLICLGPMDSRPTNFSEHVALRAVLLSHSGGSSGEGAYAATTTTVRRVAVCVCGHLETQPGTATETTAQLR